MRALKPALLALGAVLILMGLLWVGQGMGWVRWPASSFMIDQRTWEFNGAGMVVVGIALVLAGRRRA